MLLKIMQGETEWGTMTLSENTSSIRFSGQSVSFPAYGVILRVWGISAGKAPLLIGVAEPADSHLAINRTMSKQYLTDLGYYPNLPESYYAGAEPPQIYQESKSRTLEALLCSERIQAEETQSYVLLQCPFDQTEEFALAFAFCMCTLRDGCAILVWEKETDRPISPFSPEYMKIINEKRETDSL